MLRSIYHNACYVIYSYICSEINKLNHETKTFEVKNEALQDESCI